MQNIYKVKIRRSQTQYEFFGHNFEYIENILTIFAVELTSFSIDHFYETILIGNKIITNCIFFSAE